MNRLKSPDPQHCKTFFWIENPLNIKEVMSQNVLAMSILSIKRIKGCTAFKESKGVMHSMLCVLTLLTQKIKACNTLNAMYINTVDTMIQIRLSVLIAGNMLHSLVSSQ